MHSILAVLVVASVLLATSVDAMSFDLPARGHRCFTEELVGKQEFEFNYAAAPGYAQFVDIKVSDPHNAIVWSNIGKDRGQWKTLIEVGGEYAFCFYSRLVPGVSGSQEGMKRTVFFEMSNAGNSADDYVKLATQQQLKPLEVNLRIMEDAVRAVHTEYIYLKERESAMRDTSEHMFSRAMWLSFMVMFIIVGFSLWQIRHVKSHFKKKRMLD